MTVARIRSDSARTREQLLDAAERLFAAQGIASVSLRMINAASGARNVSAAHYHFGSKDGVIEALVARRMGALAVERMAGLDAVERAAGGGRPDLRATVEVMVLPLLRMLMHPTGAHFVTFLARAAGEPTVQMGQLAPAEFWQVLGRFLDVLRRALPHLSARVLAVRLGFLIQQTVISVAEIDRLLRRDGAERTWDALATLGDDLVDYFVGGLAAPSRDTASAEGGAERVPGTLAVAVERAIDEVDAGQARERRAAKAVPPLARVPASAGRPGS